MIKEIYDKNLGNIKILRLESAGTNILMLELVFNYGSYCC